MSWGSWPGTSGLATAALPNGAQEVAHRTLGAVGVKVPHGDRYQGPECGGEFKNHGQYVKSHPKEKRAEAAKSRCGKPVQAGTGDDSADEPKGTGCQGPPPWAGKGKPDKAAKAARKQACGDAGKDDKDKAPAAPDADARNLAPEAPAAVTTDPPASDTPAPTPTTTTEPPRTPPRLPSPPTTGGETTSTTAAGSEVKTTTTA